jgi:2-keto-4-pentenoate hydratase
MFLGRAGRPLRRAAAVVHDVEQPGERVLTFRAERSLMLPDDQRREAAHLLARAESDRVPVAPLAQSFPGIDVVDAYEIQLINIRRRVDSGAAVVGHKVGLSSLTMQQMMGIDEPDFGHLLSDMEHGDERPVDATRYLFPRVEVEVGFILGAELPGHGCTEEDVLEATVAVAPAIELIDSRIRDWRIGLVDTIADNASSAGFVLGAERVKPCDLDLATIDVCLLRNREVVAEGRSDAVLGNPVVAVAWLARKVAAFGVRLEAGHVILPGSCTRAIDVRPGDGFVADFEGLGSVRLAFNA